MRHSKCRSFPREEQPVSLWCQHTCEMLKSKTNCTAEGGWHRRVPTTLVGTGSVRRGRGCRGERRDVADSDARVDRWKGRRRGPRPRVGPRPAGGDSSDRHRDLDLFAGWEADARTGGGHGRGRATDHVLRAPIRATMKVFYQK